MSENSLLKVDIVVAGGGMVGGALACALGQQGFRVAVIELREPKPDWPKNEVDLRVSALTRASQRILQNLGAWKRMESMRITPYQEMQVWDATGSGSIHFDAASVGEPDLGHIVENRVTQLALWERLAALDSVVRLCPDAIKQIDMESNVSTLVLGSGRRIQFELLVGAEGANSPVREMLGITSSGWAHNQNAIVATIQPERHHNEVARQRFMATGPLAFLPIEGGSCSIVWTTTPIEAERLMALDDELFCLELTEASESMLGQVTHVGPRAAFPLRLRNADHYVLPGLALVGDAAHGIHPLAGQGVNLGFLDAAVLADVLVDARESGRPIGAMATLRRYERARKGANLSMLGAMDAFKRLFSNNNPPLTLLRNLGLNLANASGPMKYAVIRRAMGLIGELPSLAKR
ncbi:MAG: UbiH/UbiF/VisC/COQ6 family ubiquinone biosynthesis hydroxylase [Candidatus Sedimenticola sp. (ex Thyasira tokunagai)]